MHSALASVGNRVMNLLLIKPLRTAFNRGFTMIELATTIAIVGIGLTIAMPDLSSFIRRNQMSAGTNDMLAAVNVVRTEAVKRSVPTVLCASTDAINCSGTPTNWDGGYIGFVDLDGNGARNVTLENLITSGTAQTSGVQVRSAGATTLRFAPNGLLAGGTQGIRMTVSVPAVALPNENRYICVALAGRATALSALTFTNDARFAACRAL